MSDALLNRLDQWTRSEGLQNHFIGVNSARRDMERAAARIRELEAQLAKADALTAAGFAEYERRLAAMDVAADARVAALVEALRECEAEIDQYIRHEYPGDHPVHQRYRARDFAANPARSALAAFRGDADE